jgi:tetratricopeptide (TPR) repeat protein
MTRTLVVVLVTTLCAVPTIARAQDNDQATQDDQADKLYQEGLKHYNLAEYDDAIESFKAAYKISNAAGLLYNIAQAYRLKGDCQNALTFYKNYLRNQPDAKNADKVAQRIAEMEQCVKDKAPATQTSVTPPDDKNLKPPDDQHKVPPPDDDKIKPHDQQKPPPDLHPHHDPQHDAHVPIPPRRENDHAGRTLRWVGAGAVITGVAALGTGVAFGMSAADLSKQISNLYGMNGTVMWSKQYADVESRGKRDDAIGIGCDIAGAALVVGGGVLWYLGHRAGSHHAELAVVPMKGGAAAVAAWEF